MIINVVFKECLYSQRTNRNMHSDKTMIVLKLSRDNSLMVEMIIAAGDK